MPRLLFETESLYRNKKTIKLKEELESNKLCFNIDGHNVSLNKDQATRLKSTIDNWLDNQRISYVYPKRIYDAPFMHPVAYRRIDAKRNSEGNYNYKFLIKHLNNKVYDILSGKRIYTLDDYLFRYSNEFNDEFTKRLYSNKYWKIGNNCSKALVNNNKKNYHSLFAVLIEDLKTNKLHSEIGVKAEPYENINSWLIYDSKDESKWIPIYNKYTSIKTHSWYYIRIPQVKIE